MTGPMIAEKVRQYCLWFFWNKEWPREKIFILAAMVLLVLLLHAITKKRTRTSKKTQTVPVREGRNWRS